MNDRKLLDDIVEAIVSIENIAVASYDEFLSDSKTQDAILYNLIILGEAANRISDQFKEKHSTIPWSAMIGTRNIIVHGYDQVKYLIIWKIIKNDLATLKRDIRNLLEATS